MFKYLLEIAKHSIFSILYTKASLPFQNNTDTHQSWLCGWFVSLSQDVWVTSVLACNFQIVPSSPSDLK